jgi:hypothetical protein
VDEELETERSLRLICDECGAMSDLRAFGWEALLTHEENESEGVAFFCPDCVAELF